LSVWLSQSNFKQANGRVYISYLNQFIQPDTIVPDPLIPADWNKYTYVGNNPVNFIDPSGKTRTSASYIDGTNFYKCVFSTQLYNVEQTVRYDVCRLIPELEEAGIFEDKADWEHITSGYRDPKLAHVLSTAFHIIHGMVSVSDLQKNPIDLDRNVWYRDEWKYLFPDCPGINIVITALRDRRIKQNASAQVPPEYYNSNYSVGGIKSPAYALEGYESTDAYRLPNSNSPTVSKHVLGIAVDIGDGLINPNRKWDQKIDDIARKYNLARPYHQLRIDYANVDIDEWWHFERP
jgi:RHS repeat-associated protein